MAGWVQSLGTTGSSSSATTLVLTVGTITTVPIGDYVFVAVTANGSASTWSMTDSRANTYTLEKQESTTAPFTGIFKTQVASGKQLQTADTITWTTTSQGGRALSAQQYTGLTTGTLDKSNTGTSVANTTATVTASAANANANTIEIAAFGMGGATTTNAASGWNTRAKGVSSGTIREMQPFDRLVSALETASCVQTWATSVTTGSVIVTYQVNAPVTATRQRGVHVHARLPQRLMTQPMVGWR